MRKKKNEKRKTGKEEVHYLFCFTVTPFFFHNSHWCHSLSVSLNALVEGPSLWQMSIVMFCGPTVCFLSTLHVIHPTLTIAHVSLRFLRLLLSLSYTPTLSWTLLHLKLPSLLSPSLIDCPLKKQMKTENKDCWGQNRLLKPRASHVGL